MKVFMIFIATLAFRFSVAAPVGGQKGDGDAEKEKNTCTAQQCYFSKVRVGFWEKKPRPEKSAVSSKCSDKLISIGDLLDWPINPKTGETNAVELLLCRGTGNCDINLSDPETREAWKKVEICEQHADELLRKWEDSHSSYRRQHIYHNKQGSTASDVCTMPDEIGRKHKIRPHDRLRPLKINEADAIEKELGILVHPGIPICNHHEQYLKDLMKNEQSNPRKKIKIDPCSTVDSEDDTCSDPDFLVPASHEKNDAAASLFQFAKRIGVERVCFPRKPFPELKERTKEKKAQAVRKMFDVVVDIVAPDDKEDFKNRVLGKVIEDESWTSGSSKDIDSVMKQVAAQFFAAEVRTSRLIVLSLVANSLPYLKVEKYIPSLSYQMYRTARKFARRDQKAEEPIKKLEKYNPLALHSFIEFITSPNVMIGLPNGVRKVKMSDGSKVEIPNSIRQQSATEIYNMYSNVLQETNQPELMLSKSSIFRILDVCAATKREATVCVDYFIANGVEAFDKLHEILDDWMKEGLMDLDTVKKVKTELFEAAQYLRTDYRLHIKEFSRIPDHCASFALSDPNDPKMSSSCSKAPTDHKHDFKCDRCEFVGRTLKNIRIYSEEFVANSQEIESSSTQTQREEELIRINKYTDNIFEMKKHLLRAAFTNQERANIIQELGDNQALITLDFAQKYLPKWHRQKQSDYFGQKGINYHIAHVTARIGKNLAEHSFVHIYEQEVAQDSGLVVFTIAHIAEELKKIGINRISLRSDNAGAYHCASTITALHWLNQTTGMTIDSYTFSEAQNGKSSSDRDANRVKRKAESYVSKGNDITTSEKFFMALKGEKQLNGVSIHHGSVTIEKFGESKWPGIANLNHFTVEKNGIRARRYGSIGEGQFVAKSHFKPPRGSFKFDGAGFVADGIESIDAERNAFINALPTKFWYHSECAKTSVSGVSSCLHEADDITPEFDETTQENDDVIGTLFACPEPGCSATFLRSSNLDKHVLRGQHKVAPEKMTMRDFALKMFRRQLEGVDQTRSCPIVGDAISQLKETSEELELRQGWALPKKQQRKPFELDVKRFLIECFEEGLKNKKRLNPLTVEQRMVNAKKPDGSMRFSLGELKDSRQIAGYFSREAEKRRTAHLSRTKRSTEEAYKEEYIVPEDEHEDAGLIRFLKDEATWTSGDEIFNALMENDEPIFTY